MKKIRKKKKKHPEKDLWEGSNAPQLKRVRLKKKKIKAFEFHKTVTPKSEVEWDCQ